MIKFRGVDPANGRTVVGIGLSDLNITYLQRGAPIRVDLRTLGIEAAIDVLIFAGADENTMAAGLAIGPDTVIHDDLNAGGG